MKVKHILVSAMLLAGAAGTYAQNLQQVVVGASESIELTAGETIDELVVLGNELSTGQVRLPNGVATIKKFIYKHTFTPGRWNYLAFPSDINLEKCSNLATLGYTFNGEGETAWVIRSFNESKGIANGWEMLSTPVVTANRGYIMALGQTGSKEPVEVTFTFDNVVLDMETNKQMVGVALDLNGSALGKQKFYIAPKGIKGNVLAIDVDYQPTQTDDVPMNYQVAIEEARIIPFDNGTKFRISLPTNEPATVYILDKKGEKIIAGYSYEAPAAIDVKKLRKGEYPVVIQYGSGVALKTLPCKTK